MYNFLLVLSFAAPLVHFWAASNGLSLLTARFKRSNTVFWLVSQLKATSINAPHRWSTFVQVVGYWHTLWRLFWYIYLPKALVFLIIFHWPRCTASDEGLCTWIRLPMTWSCCLFHQLAERSRDSSQA